MSVELFCVLAETNLFLLQFFYLNCFFKVMEEAEENGPHLVKREFERSKHLVNNFYFRIFKKILN